MSFWVGFADAVDKIQDRKFKKELLAEKEFKQRSENLMKTISTQRQQDEKKAAELASLGSRLRAYGVEDTIVDTVLSTGDIKNISGFIGNLDENYTLAQQAGRGQQYLETVGTTLENAIVTPQGTRTIQGEELADLLNLSTDEFGLEDFGLEEGLQVTTPGSLGYVPPVYTEERDVKDYREVEKRIADNAKTLAQNEKRRLDQQLSAINRRLESATLSENEEAALREDQSVLMSRNQTVGQALDSYSGDEKDAFPLLSIYGTQSVGKITSDFSRFDPSKLLPSFQQNIGKAPMAVTSAEQAQRLVQAGVLQEGDSVMLNGSVVTIQFED